jgi:pSer/pThr/pTyr-binding forkhead associated (FHA) protein
MFEVTVCTTDGKALRRFDLSRLRGEGARVLIGRADDCEIRIKSPGISRHHCAVEIDDQDWVIRDLGSTHGTRVDGVQISEAAIVAGLKVDIGPAVLMFESTAGRVAAEIGKELEGAE